MASGPEAARIIGDSDWPVLGRRLPLSPQQTRIAQLIVEEDLNALAIAVRLDIQPGSVSKQLKRMYKKLSKRGPEVRSRAALVNRVWVEYHRMRPDGRS